MLHLYISDVTLSDRSLSESLTSSLKPPKSLKLHVVYENEFKEFGTVSREYLGKHLYKFNQTIPIPIRRPKDVELKHYLHFKLFSPIANDDLQRLGTGQLGISASDDILTKTVVFHDDVTNEIVGRASVTVFFNQSKIAIGEGSHVQEISVDPKKKEKEYAFLLSRRLRRSHVPYTPVAHDPILDHRISEETDWYIQNNVKIPNTLASKTKRSTSAPVRRTGHSEPPAALSVYHPATPSMTFAKSSRTKTPTRTRIVASSAVPLHSTAAGASANGKWTPPKLRKTCMSVGYVHNHWPETDTAEYDKKMYQLQLANERKMELLKAIDEQIRHREQQQQRHQQLAHVPPSVKEFVHMTEAEQREHQLREAKTKRLQQEVLQREAEIKELQTIFNKLRIETALTSVQIGNHPTYIDPHLPVSPSSIAGTGLATSLALAHSMSSTVAGHPAKAKKAAASATTNASSSRQATTSGQSVRRSRRSLFSDVDDDSDSDYEPVARKTKPKTMTTVKTTATATATKEPPRKKTKTATKTRTKKASSKSVILEPSHEKVAVSGTRRKAPVDTGVVRVKKSATTKASSKAKKSSSKSFSSGPEEVVNRVFRRAFESLDQPPTTGGAASSAYAPDLVGGTQGGGGRLSLEDMLTDTRASSPPRHTSQVQALLAASPLYRSRQLHRDAERVHKLETSVLSAAAAAPAPAVSSSVKGTKKPKKNAAATAAATAADVKQTTVSGSILMPTTVSAASSLSTGDKAKAKATTTTTSTTTAASRKQRHAKDPKVATKMSLKRRQAQAAALDLPGYLEDLEAEDDRLERQFDERRQDEQFASAYRRRPHAGAAAAVTAVVDSDADSDAAGDSDSDSDSDSSSIAGGALQPLPRALAKVSVDMDDDVYDAKLHHVATDSFTDYVVAPLQWPADHDAAAEAKDAGSPPRRRTPPSPRDNDAKAVTTKSTATAAGGTVGAAPPSTGLVHHSRHSRALDRIAKNHQYNAACTAAPSSAADAAATARDESEETVDRNAGYRPVASPPLQPTAASTTTTTTTATTTPQKTKPTPPSSANGATTAAAATASAAEAVLSPKTLSYKNKLLKRLEDKDKAAAASTATAADRDDDDTRDTTDTAATGAMSPADMDAFTRANVTIAITADDHGHSHSRNGHSDGDGHRDDDDTDATEYAQSVHKMRMLMPVVGKELQPTVVSQFARNRRYDAASGSTSHGDGHDDDDHHHRHPAPSDPATMTPPKPSLASSVDLEATVGSAKKHRQATVAQKKKLKQNVKPSKTSTMATPSSSSSTAAAMGQLWGSAGGGVRQSMESEKSWATSSSAASQRRRRAAGAAATTTTAAAVASSSSSRHKTVAASWNADESPRTWSAKQRAQHPPIQAASDVKGQFNTEWQRIYDAIAAVEKKVKKASAKSATTQSPAVAHKKALLPKDSALLKPSPSRKAAAKSATDAATVTATEAKRSATAAAAAIVADAKGFAGNDAAEAADAKGSLSDGDRHRRNDERSHKALPSEAKGEPRVYRDTKHAFEDTDDASDDGDEDRDVPDDIDLNATRNLSLHPPSSTSPLPPAKTSASRTAALTSTFLTSPSVLSSSSSSESGDDSDNDGDDADDANGDDDENDDDDDDDDRAFEALQREFQDHFSP